MKKGIDWNRCSKEERDYYDYYRSLGYDERTATVLALFTYGSYRDAKTTIDTRYQRILGQQSGINNVGETESVRGRFDRLLHSVTAPASSRKSSNMSSGAPGAKASLDAPSFLRSARPAPSPVRGSSAGKEHALRVERFEAEESSMSAPVEAYASAPMDFMAGPAPSSTASFTGALPSPVLFAGRQMETDEYDPIEEKEFRNAFVNMTSTFRMTTNTASAGVVLNQLRSDRRIDTSMVRIEEMLNYFRYQSEKPEAEKFKISHELSASTGGKKLLYINVQGKEEVKERQNIVILLDVSGSMSGNAKKTQAMVATIISKLKAGDKLSLVTYSSRDEVVLKGMRIWEEADKIKALEALLGLAIFGGTYGSAGIETAYEIGKEEYVEGGNNQVILITDGDLNFGITDRGGLEELIEEKKKSNLFLSVIGTGLYNYKDDKLETLAKHGNGVYRTVNNLADVKKCIDEEYASLVNVIAKDVKAQIEFNPEVVESYRLLGFENREISHEDFVNDKVISEPFGSGGYGVALYELVLRGSGKPVESGSKYAKVVTTGSSELGTVKVRYKEPLEDTSKEIEYAIPSVEEIYTDNLRLAYVVYVCAEKLRGSDKITEEDVKKAQKFCDELGAEIREMNKADLYKLPEILRRTARELHVGIDSDTAFDW
ncbi:MAG: von Willebrand factor type A domain-containing protein [Lachnospiraceae bacterium]|nr:von Willebrand factor type A domain-containing protein [Lachnospiraceae bacterium]